MTLLTPTYLKPSDDGEMKDPGRNLVVSVTSSGHVEAINLTPRTAEIHHESDFIVIYDGSLAVLAQIQRVLDDNGLSERSDDRVVEDARKAIRRMDIFEEVVSTPSGRN